MTAGVLTAATGAAIGAGALLCARAAADCAGAAARPGKAAAERIRAAGPRVSGAVLAGGLAWWATGWPVAALLAGAAVWWLPRMLGPDRETLGEAERIEAVASWAEQLRDMIAGASGLQHAVTATADIAPEPVRAEVRRLVERLRTGTAPQEALRRFAAEVDTGTADLVASALATALSSAAGDLGGLLGRLADAARERAVMMARTSASRARVRSSVRIIVATTVLLAAGMVLLNRPYLAPFDTAAGQLVLAAAGAVWGAGLFWLRRLSRPVRGPRLLAAPAAAEEAVQ